MFKAIRINMKKFFKNPWMRIWLLCSFLWIVGFNVWCYYSWEKTASVAKLLLAQQEEAGVTYSREVSSENRIKYDNYWLFYVTKGSFSFSFSVLESQFGIHWFYISCFGPSVVGLIFIYGLRWIIVGFKSQTT